MSLTAAELTAGLDDAARCIVERHNLALLSLTTDEIMASSGRWFLAKLADGSSDPTIYDSWEAAQEHNRDYRYAVPVRIQPTGMPQAEAVTYLAFVRAAVANGYRLPSPRHQPIMPTTREHVMEAGGHTLTAPDLVPLNMDPAFLEILRHDPIARHAFD